MRETIARALRAAANKIHPETGWRVVPITMKRVTTDDVTRIFGQPLGGDK